MSNSQIERILDGSGELFLQAGIKSVTMDDIAKHLGMSKKTIYQFFKDKNELVLALVKKRLKDDEDEMSELLAKSGNVIEGMINMMKCSEEIFGRANPVIIHDMQKYHPEAWKEFQNFKSGVIVRTMEQLLSRGIQQGYIRPEVDVKILARMRMMQVEMGFNPQAFPANEFNLWKVQRELMEHFNYGICTMKGYKLLNEYKNIHEEID
ncbi:MAG TPA: TetR/AcrR family transcriptional regulator [Mucilaginibacter sp.]|nr:TetR/AcrR family transcriptional regulator [Mucilaginibacter sp.]HVW13193.1 TetR/AcrR family transcriptional regulator [Mucilaginibacter sp.]